LDLEGGAMKKFNLTLVYDGTEWIAKNGDIVARGKTLEELDENLKNALKSKLKNGEKAEVRMEYDYASFPFWIVEL